LDNGVVLVKGLVAARADIPKRQPDYLGLGVEALVPLLLKAVVTARAHQGIVETMGRCSNGTHPSGPAPAFVALFANDLIVLGQPGQHVVYNRRIVNDQISRIKFDDLADVQKLHYIPQGELAYDGAAPGHIDDQALSLQDQKRVFNWDEAHPEFIGQIRRPYPLAGDQLTIENPLLQKVNNLLSNGRCLYF
jgi:hypothetical protein